MFWKEGDDLRLDRVVLFMLDVFNGIWRAARVRYLPLNALDSEGRRRFMRTTTRKRTDDALVQAVTYRVANADFSHGFVECLQDFKEVADETMASVSAWKKSESLFSSTVATLVSAHVLDIRDRHDGNMGLTHNRLANIDFGWTRRPDFCLPTSLREL